MKKLDFRNPYKNDPEINKELQEALAALRQDEPVVAKIRKLGLTNSEVRSGLAALLDYQEDYHICENCPGLASCPKQRQGYQMDICREHDTLHETFSPCNLKLKDDAEKGKFVRRDFPEEWSGKDLRSVEPSRSTRNPLLKEMMLIAKHESSRWLFVKGDRKSGKSFILCAYAHQIARVAPGVAYLDTKAVFDELKYQCVKEHAKFERNLALLQNCPLVVLDRFGEEYKSDYVYENILKPLIRYREENDLLTAFGSRYSLPEILEKYRLRVHDADSLEETFARIKKKMGKEYDITGVKIYA